MKNFSSIINTVHIFPTKNELFFDSYLSINGKPNAVYVFSTIENFINKMNLTQNVDNKKLVNLVVEKLKFNENFYVVISDLDKVYFKLSTVNFEIKNIEKKDFGWDECYSLE